MLNLPHAASPVSHRSPTPSPLEQPSPGAGPRARSAEVRPSSWRIAGIPLAPLGQAIARGLRAMSCCIRPRAAQGLDRVREQPSSPSFDTKNRSGDISSHDLSRLDATTRSPGARRPALLPPERPQQAQGRTAAFESPSGGRPSGRGDAVVFYEGTVRDGKGSAPAQLTGLDDHECLPTAPTQLPKAEALGLPISFTALRPSRLTEAPGTKQSDLPRLLTPDNLATVDSAHLDAFLTFCATQDYSAENPLFVIAAQMLLATEEGSAERAALATRMQTAFTEPSAPLPPNFDTKNGLRVRAAIAAVARGDAESNLREVLEGAQRNLISSFGVDAFSRFLKTLPA